MINSAIVLGGGNAGLMSALYLKTSIHSLDISVIKSKKIGTIGVGEGSTEHWTRFANAVGISMVELIEQCGATIKIGIKFENWHGDGHLAKRLPGDGESLGRRICGRHAEADAARHRQ